MKKALVNNSTDSLIVIENSARHYEIAPHSQENIEYESNDTFRVFKSCNRSSRFCISQYFQKDTLRNIWIFNPAITINLDSYIKLSNQTRRINVSERKYHFYMFAIFNILIFDDAFADFNDYHEKSDKNKLMLLSALYLLPVFLGGLFLAIISLFGIISDFSFEDAFIYLLCLIPLLIFVAMYRAFRKVISIDEELKRSSTNLKRIAVHTDLGRKIKYSDKF